MRSATVELGYIRPQLDLEEEPPVLDLDAPCWTQKPMSLPCFDKYQRIVLDREPL